MEMYEVTINEEENVKDEKKDLFKKAVLIGLSCVTARVIYKKAIGPRIERAIDRMVSESIKRVTSNGNN